LLIDHILSSCMYCALCYLDQQMHNILTVMSIS